MRRLVSLSAARSGHPLSRHFPIDQMEIGNQAFAGVATDGSKPHVIYSSRIATARVNPAEAALILNGKAETVKPVLGNWSRLVIFSIWQYP